MTVLFMEGFEDINSADDLIPRGETGPMSIYTGVGPARYAGGKSLYRGYYGTAATHQVFQRPHQPQRRFPFPESKPSSCPTGWQS